MDLQNSIQCRLDTLFRGFLQMIADHFELDFNELHKFVESVDLGNGMVIKSLTCMHKITRGDNKGRLCKNKALDNGYCGRHQNSASATVGTIIKKTNRAKSKGPTNISQSRLSMYS